MWRSWKSDCTRVGGSIIRAIMLSRREMLLAPAALLAMRAAEAADGKMTLALHQNTSSRAGFRGSLEGWAKAGIKEVEITNNLLDGFLKSEKIGRASCRERVWM